MNRRVTASTPIMFECDGDGVFVVEVGGAVFEHGLFVGSDVDTVVRVGGFSVCHGLRILDTLSSIDMIA